MREYIADCISDIASKIPDCITDQLLLSMRHVPQRLQQAGNEIAGDLEKQEHQPKHEFEWVAHG
jgi:hypothetical protein